MADIRITDILQNEHIDFLEICLNSNKRYRELLSNVVDEKIL